MSIDWKLMSIASIQQSFDAQGGAINQRFEIKYLVSEMMAQSVIDFISPYMDPDPQGRVYPVTSLYLDNDPMSMYWSSEMGERNRYKLRLRSYTDAEGFQVFAEVKRRLDRVVLKTRVAIRNDQIDALLNGSGTTEDIALHPEKEKSINDLAYFRDLLDTFQAKPCATVRYMREAYVSMDGEPLRITFDRDLACIPTKEYTEGIWSAQTFWRTLPQVPVVLELKFTDHYPGWVQQLIQRFGLERTSMAKYVECVKSLRSDGVPIAQEMHGVVL